MRLLVVALVLLLVGCPQPPPAATSIPQPKAEAPIVSTVPVAARKYQRQLTAAAHALWGLDASVPTFGAQIQQESGWNESAKSGVGAQGLAQFMPRTADWLSDLYPNELGPAQPFNPSWALQALVRYDRYLWQRVKSDHECDHMAFALSGYNGGAGWTNRDIALASTQGIPATQYWDGVERVNAGRSEAAWKQNRDYPRRILLVLQPRYVTWGRIIDCGGAR